MRNQRVFGETVIFDPFSLTHVAGSGGIVYFTRKYPEKPPVRLSDVHTDQF